MSDRTKSLVLTKIKEISDVPKGANPYADTRIVKSAPGESVKLEDIIKGLDGLTDADRAEVAKAVEVVKADPLAGLPADHPVVKQLNAQAEIAKAQAAELALLKQRDAERAEAEGIAKCSAEAESYGVQTITKADGVLFRKADNAGFGAELRAFVAKLAGPLKVAESKLTKMAGSVGDGGESSLAKAVTEIMKADPKLSRAEAADRAIRANPNLYGSE